LCEVKNDPRNHTKSSAEFKHQEQQSDSPIDRLQQLIKERCSNDLAGHLDEIDGEAKLKQSSVRQYIRRRGSQVAENNQPFTEQSPGPICPLRLSAERTSPSFAQGDEAAIQRSYRQSTSKPGNWFNQEVSTGSGSDRVWVSRQFASKAQRHGFASKVGGHGVITQRAAEQRSALRPKASLRALGSHASLIGAAEQRLMLCCSNISLAANKTQSPLRGSKQISIVTQGSQTRLGPEC
jgi:hypothetical protein